MQPLTWQSCSSRLWRGLARAVFGERLASLESAAFDGLDDLPPLLLIPITSLQYL